METDIGDETLQIAISGCTTVARRPPSRSPCGPTGVQAWPHPRPLRPRADPQRQSREYRHQPISSGFRRRSSSSTHTTRSTTTAATRASTSAVQLVSVRAHQECGEGAALHASHRLPHRHAHYHTDSSSAHGRSGVFYYHNVGTEHTHIGGIRPPAWGAGGKKDTNSSHKRGVHKVCR